MIPLALFQIGLGDAIAAGSGNLFFHFFAHLGADKKWNTAECLFSVTVPGHLHKRTALLGSKYHIPRNSNPYSR